MFSSQLRTGPGGALHLAACDGGQAHRQEARQDEARRHVGYFKTLFIGLGTDSFRSENCEQCKLLIWQDYRFMNNNFYQIHLYTYNGSCKRIGRELLAQPLCWCLGISAYSITWPL